MSAQTGGERRSKYRDKQRAREEGRLPHFEFKERALDDEIDASHPIQGVRATVDLISPTRGYLFVELEDGSSAFASLTVFRRDLKEVSIRKGLRLDCKIERVSGDKRPRVTRIFGTL